MKSLYKTKREMIEAELQRINDNPFGENTFDRQKALSNKLKSDSDLDEFVIVPMVKSAPLLGKQLQEIPSGYVFDAAKSIAENAKDSLEKFRALAILCRGKFIPDTYKLDPCGGRAFVYSQQIDFEI